MEAVSQAELQKIGKLSDEQFDQAFAQEIRAEAKHSMRVVYFIREADRRKHWLKECSSLAGYCAKHGISNTDFYRKLSVLNTIRELPEIEKKIIEGTLNTTTVSQVHTFCRMEARTKKQKVTTLEKRELLLKIEGQSERAVGRELAQRSPQSAIPDKKRQISENLFSSQYTSDQALEDKLARLKELLSNSLPASPTQNELLHKICDVALNELDPVRKARKSANRKQARELAKASKVSTQKLNNNGDCNDTADADAPKGEKVKEVVKVDEVEGETPSLVINCVTGVQMQKPKRSRVISATTKRLVRLRDGDQCAIIHSKTGKRCETRIGLQFDHIIPYAKGGDNSVENLRQACRMHNQWLAIREFGRKKMAQYVLSLDS